LKFYLMAAMPFGSGDWIIGAHESLYIYWNHFHHRPRSLYEAREKKAEEMSKRQSLYATGTRAVSGPSTFKGDVKRGGWRV
jgi:hypothetical protein